LNENADICADIPFEMKDSRDHIHSHDHDHDHNHDPSLDSMNVALNKTEAHSHSGHNHSHGGHGHHHHGHASVPKHITRAFVVGIVLNSAFVITEVVAGLYTNSLALLTDAGHNLSDVASLALALLATRFALKKASNTYTFGYKQSTVLVALLNAGILLLALGAVAYEAIVRLLAHTAAIEINSTTVAIVATVGIVINSITALLFMRGKDKDLNLRGAYMHMAADALVSLGVVIAGIIMYYTHYFWLDSVLSLGIVFVIVYGTWGLLRESLRLSMNGVPSEINLDKIRAFFQKQPGITDVHDLHVWAMSTTENALTVHLVMPAGLPDHAFYKSIREELKHHYGIGHSTIQIEQGKTTEACGQEC
jgi:cobalt-zinc-cadmium efflux system protein